MNAPTQLDQIVNAPQYNYIPNPTFQHCTKAFNNVKEKVEMSNKVYL